MGVDEELGHRGSITSCATGEWREELSATHLDAFASGTFIPYSNAILHALKLSANRSNFLLRRRLDLHYQKMASRTIANEADLVGREDPTPTFD